MRTASPTLQGYRRPLALGLLELCLVSACGGDDTLGPGGRDELGLPPLDLDTRDSTDASDTSSGHASDTGDTIIPTAEAELAAKMYTLQYLPEFHISLDEAARESLRAAPKQYVRGNFEYAGQRYGDVAVRLKGNLTLTELDEKPSFKVKFNKFVKGRRFAGVEALTLNNMYSDASMLREWLAYKLFREAGVPASRAGYARVYLDGEYYGVYLNLETVDDAFLAHHFSGGRGALFEGEHGADLDGEVSDFELDEGEPSDLQHLQTLLDLAARPDGALFDPQRTSLDLPHLWSFLAAEAFVGQFDGYWISHNYFIYRENSSEQWSFLPWSLDQTMSRRLDPFAAQGFVSIACRHDPNCLVQMVQHAQAVAQLGGRIDWQSDIDQINELIGSSAAQDRHKRHDHEDMREGRDRVIEFLMERPATMLEQLDCLVEGREIDEDFDGYGVCFADCNDADPEIHAEAAEVCDGIDNDCNGDVDDHPSCPCPTLNLDSTVYHLCPHIRSWRSAVDACDERGLELAKIATEAHNERVWAEAQDLRASKWAIGLNDDDKEGDFRWQDGSTPSFTTWGLGEPDDRLDWFDCVFFMEFQDPNWGVYGCGSEGAFICTEP